MILKEIQDIPSDWKVINVRKKTTVKIRPCNGIERFKVSWSDSDLVSNPETDLIVISSDGREYPCKEDIFFETYVHVEKPPGGAKSWDIWDYSYIKKYVYQLVEIPEGVELSVLTLEGQVDNVKYPDFVAIGPRNELYVNTRETFEKHLEVVN